MKRIWSFCGWLQIRALGRVKISSWQFDLNWVLFWSSYVRNHVMFLFRWVQQLSIKELCPLFCSSSPNPVAHHTVLDQTKKIGTVQKLEYVPKTCFTAVWPKLKTHSHKIAFDRCFTNANTKFKWTYSRMHQHLWNKICDQCPASIFKWSKIILCAFDNYLVSIFILISSGEYLYIRKNQD